MGKNIRPDLETSFYKLGYEFGKIIAPKNLDEVKKIFNDGNLGTLIEVDWNILKLENSAIGKSIASNKPVCNYIAGLLSGALESIYGKKFIVKEIKCIAQGCDACYFEVKDTGRLADADDNDSMPS